MTVARPHSSAEWLPISRRRRGCHGSLVAAAALGAGLGVLAATALARQLLDVSVPVVAMAVVGLVILAYNAVLWLVFKRLGKGGRAGSARRLV